MHQKALFMDFLSTLWEITNIFNNVLKTKFLGVFLSVHKQAVTRGNLFIEWMQH